MSKQIENKQAEAPVNKQVKGGPKVWRLTSPQGRPYLTSDPVEARHLISTKGYTEASE